VAPQREWFEKDYYKVLGVKEDASQKDVTRAYRKLARQYHPDANAGDSKAEERFKEVSAAYDVVGDPEKRKEYDEVRKLGPMGGFGPGGPGGFGAGGFGPGGFNIRADDIGDISDLLGGLFNRTARRRGPGGRAGGGQPGEDLQAELHLSFLDAVNGATTAVNLVGDAPCSTCGGSGAAPGTHPTTCTRCGGRGVTDDNQGFFSFSQPCPACRGSGRQIDNPCPACAGRGLERRAREVKVRIPAGVEDSQRIRLAGRGAPGRNGGPPGDLYVTVRVAPHPVFGRRGKDLTLTVPVTYAEAVLGAEITIPTLPVAAGERAQPADSDGRVTLRVPPGTRSGRTFRVRGRGIATARGQGDLLVTVELAVPANPSSVERKLVEELAKLGPGGIRDRLTPPA
jgi:molecular chaperone DnaJ